MGTPSTVATLNGEVFYYISQRSERKVAFMNQQVVDQRVIAIYFDKNRQVQRLANYGLQDGKIFDFISRTTPTSGQELSYLTPLVQAAQLQLEPRVARTRCGHPERLTLRQDVGLPSSPALPTLLPQTKNPSRE